MEKTSSNNVRGKRFTLKKRKILDSFCKLQEYRIDNTLCHFLFNNLNKIPLAVHQVNYYYNYQPW